MFAVVLISCNVINEYVIAFVQLSFCSEEATENFGCNKTLRNRVARSLTAHTIRYGDCIVNLVPLPL